MVFDEHGTNRLLSWRQFRESLETSSDPLQQVADLWKHAPFVGPYLDPKIPNDWPDPWQLILDLRLDNLAIVLGMLYTLKLTQRFMDTECEIHMSMPPNTLEASFYLVVDNQHLLNYEPRVVHSLAVLDKVQTNTLWRSDQRL
jgi:hypothetical protein